MLFSEQKCAWSLFRFLSVWWRHVTHSVHNLYISKLYLIFAFRKRKTNTFLMGVTVSNVRSHEAGFARTTNQWFCSKCSSLNSIANYPTCQVCHQSKTTNDLSSKIRLKPSWLCKFCKYKNGMDSHLCKNCGTASMRPMSVSLHYRQQPDELNAATTFKKIVAYCQQVKWKQNTNLKDYSVCFSFICRTMFVLLTKNFHLRIDHWAPRWPKASPNGFE